MNTINSFVVDELTLLLSLSLSLSTLKGTRTNDGGTYCTAVLGINRSIGRRTKSNGRIDRYGVCGFFTALLRSSSTVLGYDIEDYNRLESPKNE